MPLDSDVPNADTLLDVLFYTKETGENKGNPYVRIMTPGDQTNIIDQPVREDHKQRFPRHWFYFQMQQAPADDAYGTPLEQWHKERPDELTEGQFIEMNILKFRVVEQIAQAADKQLQRIGMGGPGLREKARAYLASKNQSENSKQLENTQRELDELKTQMAQLLAAQGGGKGPKAKIDGLNTSAANSADNR